VVQAEAEGCKGFARKEPVVSELLGKGSD